MKDSFVIGDIWILRDSSEIVITNINEADPMPLKSWDLCWNMNGRYWDDAFDHSMDLITKKEKMQ